MTMCMTPIDSMRLAAEIEAMQERAKQRNNGVGFIPEHEKETMTEAVARRNKEKEHARQS